jgi:hypothetical protein
MGIFDFLKPRKSATKQPAMELSLSDMKVGCLVDYDLSTWEVTACNQYDWGDGDISLEWQLKSAETVAYLELEQDDDDDWSFNRKIDFSLIDAQVKTQILEAGDPPDEIRFQDETFYLQETAAGHFNTKKPSDPQPMLRWSYATESGQNYLGIEQWSEKEIDASVGIPAHSYQFSNLLPPP